MTEPAGEGWGWYWSHDEENYTGPFADRDEVIGEAEQYEREFFIIEARKGPLRPPRGEDVIGRWIELQDDDGAWGDDGFDDLLGSKEAQASAEAELDALLAAWWAKHDALFPEPYKFAQTRNFEALSPSTVDTAEA